MISLREKQNKAFEALKGTMGLKNKMQSPKIVKVIVNVGTGSFKDKNKNKIVDDRLAKITGQKAVLKAAKKSVATFKVREGDPVGYQVTLRDSECLISSTRLFLWRSREQKISEDLPQLPSTIWAITRLPSKTILFSQKLPMRN